MDSDSDARSTLSSEEETLNAISEPTETDPNLINSFSGFGFSDWLVKQCQAVGLVKPTEIQSYCIPAILSGLFSCLFAL